VTSARETREGRQRAIRFWKQGEDEFARAHLRGLEGVPGDYVLWGAQREGFRQAWRGFFREWDVLVAPAMNVLAYPHVPRAWPEPESEFRLTLDVNGRPVPYWHGLVYPALATVAGQPATAFPVGLSRGGLPIGLQAVGPYLEDLTPIRFAALLAPEIGGFRKPPGFDDR
jgi:amidase